MIRLNNDNYSDQDLKAADIATFKDHFNVDPISEGLVGDLSNPSNESYWMYNVYLVDNNALDEEILIGANRIFDSTNGINQYLQRSKYWIEGDVDYDFKIEIKENLATKAWIKPNTSGTYDLKINKGATYPSYVPSAGTALSTGNANVDALDSTRGHFGIGVGQTKGYEWIVKGTYVRTIDEVFPMHLFKFKIDNEKWSAVNSPFAVDFYGIGYDPTRYAADNNTGNSRVQAAV